MFTDKYSELVIVVLDTYFDLVSVRLIHNFSQCCLDTYPELVSAALGRLKQESRGTFFQKFITTPSVIRKIINQKVYVLNMYIEGTEWME